MSITIDSTGFLVCTEILSVNDIITWSFIGGIIFSGFIAFLILVAYDYGKKKEPPHLGVE